MTESQNPKDTLPAALPDGAFDPEQIRGWDHRAIHEFGIPGIALMENAGAGAARLLLAEGGGAFPPPYRIYCGPGNNGGDGFVVARHLHNHGQPVHLTVIVPRRGGDRPPYAPDSDAGTNFEIVRRMGLDLRVVDASDPDANAAAAGFEGDAGSPGTIVDALFGTGLSRPIEPPYLGWLTALERSACPVVALDTPSGLDARSGEVLGACLPASLTITFAARKSGFERGAGPRLTGRVEVVDIGMPRELWQGT